MYTLKLKCLCNNNIADGRMEETQHVFDVELVG